MADPSRTNGAAPFSLQKDPSGTRCNFRPTSVQKQGIHQAARVLKILNR
jgi:hypothetical protein